MTRVESWLPDVPLPFGVIAEAPADHEISQAIIAATEGRRCPGPLVGPSGWRHENALREAARAAGVEIDRRDVAHLNVFDTQLPTVVRNGKPTKNCLDPLMTDRVTMQASVAAWIAANRVEPDAGPYVATLQTVVRQPLQRRYLAREHWRHLVRLWTEVAALRDRGVTWYVLYGATAYWAMTGRDDFAEAKGHIQGCVVEGIHIIPTWHPAFTFHQQSALSTMADHVAKVVRNAMGGEATLGEPIVWVPETPDELRRLIVEYVAGRPEIAWDAEWSIIKRDTEETDELPRPGSRDDLVVTSIQLCADGVNSIVVPFSWRSGCWWRTAEAQVAVMAMLHELNDSPARNIWHNGLNSDAHVLLSELDILIRVDEDTLLMAHALNPGAPKGLTDVVGTYLNGNSWKFKRRFNKRDE